MSEIPSFGQEQFLEMPLGSVRVSLGHLDREGRLKIFGRRDGGFEERIKGEDIRIKRYDYGMIMIETNFKKEALVYSC